MLLLLAMKFNHKSFRVEICFTMTIALLLRLVARAFFLTAVGLALKDLL